MRITSRAAALTGSLPRKIKDTDASIFFESRDNKDETTQTFLGKIRKSSIIAATSVVSVLLFLGGSYGLYRYFSGPRSPLVFESVHSTRLTSNGKVRSAAVSPDGKFIVYSLRENKGQESLWLEHIGSESSVQIAAPAFVPYNGLRISADGDSVDYNGPDGSLFRIPALGGNFTKISDVKSLSASSFIGFSPDGMQIAFLRRKDTGGTTLVVSSPDGTMEKQITQFEPPIRLGLNPTWSPDRTAIACWSIESGRQNIAVVKVSDGTVTKLLGDGWPNVGYFTWMPDSRGLFVVGKGLSDSQLSLRQVWQVLYPTGDASRITTDSNNYETVSVTSDGLKLAAVRSEPVAQIWAAEDRDLKDFKQLTVGFEKFDGVLSLGWLSDERIVYDSTQNGKNSFWITDSTGSGHRRQLQDIFAQAASPDGRYLVYQKSSTASMGLWVSDLQEGVERQLTKEADVWASFSPDSKWVVYTGYHQQIALFRVPIEGGEPTMIIAANGLCPTVSPDGTKIAFFQWKAGQRSQLTVAPITGESPVKTFDVDIEIAPLSTKANLQWNSDGTAITYVGLKDGVSNLWRQNIDGGSPIEVTSFDTGRIFNFAYSQDGSRLALSRGSFDSDVILLSNHE